ncbi:keratin-associated protein 12-1-like [Oryx dammah]|uniref:keratin-associated protein 12-1-like n=1 Tax=Oryx dammah TaxID=59534 RepID=UPI001A9BF94D|nr:keratin-associated protein 12-1-like [Oryx dammah]
MCDTSCPASCQPTCCVPSSCQEICCVPSSCQPACPALCCPALGCRNPCGASPVTLLCRPACCVPSPCQASCCVPLSCKPVLYVPVGYKRIVYVIPSCQPSRFCQPSYPSLVCRPIH